MLEVIPIQTKTEQEAICARCGVSYLADDLAYQTKVDGQIVGICQFALNDKGGFVHTLCTVEGMTDTEALFVTGRGALNFIDLCGVHTAYYEVAEDEKRDETLAHAIGFRKQPDGRWKMDLTDFFNHPCAHPIPD